MEFLAKLLEPHKELVGNAAAVTTILQFFSPAFLCNDIRKQGNTNNVPIMPFLGGFILSGLNLQYGMMLRDDTMIRVSFVGLFLNILYLCCYYAYSKNKTSVWLQLGAGGAFTFGIIAYAINLEPELGEYRLGMIVTVFMMLLIASPLFDLREILRTKSTAGMPFPIIFSGTIVTFLWLLYGIILRNEFLIIQNVIALLLSVFQLFLMAIYPPTRKPTPGKRKNKKKD